MTATAHFTLCIPGNFVSSVERNSTRTLRFSVTDPQQSRSHEHAKRDPFRRAQTIHGISNRCGDQARARAGGRRGHLSNPSRSDPHHDPIVARARCGGGSGSGKMETFSIVSVSVYVGLNPAVLCIRAKAEASAPELSIRIRSGPPKRCENAAEYRSAWRLRYRIRVASCSARSHGNFARSSNRIPNSYSPSLGRDIFSPAVLRQTAASRDS